MDTNCPVVFPWCGASTTVLSAAFFAGLALVPAAFLAFALVADVLAMVVERTREDNAGFDGDLTSV